MNWTWALPERLLGQLLARSGGSSPLAADGPAALARDPSQYFSQSLDLFQKLNAEGEQARTLRAWGQFELAQGEKAPGSKKLAAALDIFQRLGMRAETARTRLLSQTTIARVRPLMSSAPRPPARYEAGPAQRLAPRLARSYSSRPTSGPEADPETLWRLNQDFAQQVLHARRLGSWSRRASASVTANASAAAAKKIV